MRIDWLPRRTLRALKKYDPKIVLRLRAAMFITMIRGKNLDAILSGMPSEQASAIRSIAPHGPRIVRAVQGMARLPETRNRQALLITMIINNPTALNMLKVDD